MAFLYWLLQLVVTAALAGIVAFVGLLFMLPTKIVNKRLNLWFDQRLEAFKAEQNERLVRLQEQLNHLTDRGRLSNEREYAATAKVWESYVDTYFATMQCVVDYQTFPDLDALGKEDLDHFLRSTELSEREMTSVKEAQDKIGKYGRLMHLHMINKAGQALHDTRELIIKQSVFIEKGLQELLDLNLVRLTKAWAEERTNFGTAHAGPGASGQELINNGPHWLDELRNKVRERLLRSLG